MPAGHDSPSRTRADLCPGVFRPWSAEDGALVRLRVPGGQASWTQLVSLAEVAASHGDGFVHLTSRANLQVRGLPSTGDGDLPDDVVEAIRRTGLLPHPGHELVRNVMASPLTGLAGGRADLRPVVAELDERLCAHPSLASLPGRFLFVLDDGRGDVAGRPLDLGLVAVSAGEAQLRLGSRHWGPVVPLAEAAARLTGLARAFLTVRGEGPTAAWHVDELDAAPEHHQRDPRTHVDGGQPTYGPVAGGTLDEPTTTRLEHLEVPGGRLDRDTVARLATLCADRLVVTPWRSLVVEWV